MGHIYFLIGAISIPFLVRRSPFKPNEVDTLHLVDDSCQLSYATFCHDLLKIHVIRLMAIPKREFLYSLHTFSLHNTMRAQTFRAILMFTKVYTYVYVYTCDTSNALILHEFQPMFTMCVTVEQRQVYSLRRLSLHVQLFASAAPTSPKTTSTPPSLHYSIPRSECLQTRSNNPLSLCR